MAVLLLVSTLLLTHPASACTCLHIQSVPEAFRYADFVAMVRVERIEDQWTTWRRLKDRLGLQPEDTGDPAKWALEYGFKVTVRVDESWKGHLGKESCIFTGRGGGDCGVPFEVGVSYLVYARATDGGQYYVSFCSRTTPADRSEADVAALAQLAHAS
ncbi:MAG: hypothetical protein AB2L07_03160 [Thermoanaerobaculaceae bacterium]